MKIANLMIAMTLILTNTAFADTKSICAPSLNSPWYEADIRLLENGAQLIYQVTARGDFIAADLICSYDECTGFVNGIQSTASLKFENVNGHHVPVALTIMYSTEPIHFTCSNQ